MSDEGAPSPAATPPAATPPPVNPEPSGGRTEQRFQQLLGKLAKAEERIKVLSAGEVERDRDSWKGKATQYQQRIEALKAEHAKAAAGWATERTMMQHGLVDREAHAGAQALYSTRPEEGRPSLSDWMSGWVTQAEDGETVDTTPPALRHYLRPTAAPVSTAAAPRPKLPGAPPVGSPGAPAGISDAIKMRAAQGDREAQEQVREYLRHKRTRRA